MLKDYVKFYYTVLTDEKKRIYRDLYNGFKTKQRIIFIQVDTQKISMKEVSDIAIYVYNDTPLFYYIDIKKHNIQKQVFGYHIIFDYFMSDAQIQRADLLIEKGVEEFKKQYILPSMSEYERELQIHDYLVKTVKYDYEAERKIDSIKGKAFFESFNAIGPLFKKKGVCWGIACAFKLLCDNCKVKCFTIIGHITGDSSDNDHAWNIVKLSENNYHIDVTWDINNSTSANVCHNYLNLNDELAKIDHSWDELFYPQSKALYFNYHYKNKLYITNLADIAPLVKEKAESGDKTISFRYSEALLDKNDIEAQIKMGMNMTLGGFSYSFLISQAHHFVFVEIN